MSKNTKWEERFKIAFVIVAAATAQTIVFIVAISVIASATNKHQRVSSMEDYVTEYNTVSVNYLTATLLLEEHEEGWGEITRDEVERMHNQRKETAATLARIAGKIRSLVDYGVTPSPAAEQILKRHGLRHESENEN